MAAIQAAVSFFGANPIPDKAILIYEIFHDDECCIPPRR